MADPKRAPRRRLRVVRRVIALMLTAAVACAGWYFLRPLFSDETIPVYQSYTAARGDVATSKSYSATLGLITSETLSNSRQVTSVKKLYVKPDQEVRKGDKLMQLETGEVLKAGIDGTVNQIRFDEGDWIWPNVSLLQISDLTHLQASLAVDEYDISGISVGDLCTVTIVPLGLQFDTAIGHVDRVSSASSSVAYYSVTAEFDVPPNVLPGMTASVSIPDQQVSGAVVLEMDALSFDGDDTPYVLVKTGDAYEKRVLETGITDGMRVEIRSGLSEGDVVYRQTGEEKAVTALTLPEIYKKLAGETVIVRDRSEPGGGRGQRGGQRME